MNTFKKSFPTIILILTLLSLYNTINSHNTYIKAAGIASNIEDIKNITKGIDTFATKIAAISNMFGFNTFLLLFAILIFSAGLSAIGIPKGKISFLVSLLIADSIWILWNESFNPESRAYLLSILKSNIIILIPLILFLITKNIFPSLFRGIKIILYSLVNREKNSFDKKSIIQLFEEYQIYNKDLNNTIITDILSSTNTDKIRLSPESYNNINKLQETLTKLKGDEGDKKVR